MKKESKSGIPNSTTLSDEGFNTLLSILKYPPKPTLALIKLMKKRKFRIAS